MSEKSWSIVGQGAVGSFCAANLVQQNIPHQIITRRKSAIAMTFIEGENQIHLNALTTLADINQIDNLLIPTKAYDVLPALKSMIPKLAVGANVVLCHNGMGTIEAICEILPTGVNLYVATTSNGAFRQGQTVTFAGKGPTYWGEVVKTDRGHPLNDKDFSALFRQATQSENISNILWNKLLINCVINPLTAIYGVKNGELANPSFAQEIAQSIGEFITLSDRLQLGFTYPEALKQVSQVINNTARNTSSMLQDVKAGRKTEIDFINGYLCSRAEQLSLTLPFHQALVARVKALSL